MYKKKQQITVSIYLIFQNEIIKDEKNDMMRASFHFPLHRYLAAFTCQAVSKMNMTLKDIIPPPDLLTLLMVHPLRVQVMHFNPIIVQHSTKCICIKSV